MIHLAPRTREAATKIHTDLGHYHRMHTLPDPV